MKYSMKFVLPTVLVCLLMSLFVSPLVRLYTHDNSVFTLAGKILNEGGRLYVDFFDHKGPIFLWLNGLGYFLTKNDWGPWLLDTLLRTTAIVTFLIGIKRHFQLSWQRLLLGGFLLAVVPAAPNFPETFCMELAMLSVGLLLVKCCWVNLFLIGVLGGMAFMTKQTCISIFFVLFCYVVMDREKRKYAIPLVLGGVLLVGACLLVLWLRGNLSDYFRCCYLFNLHYAATHGGSVIMKMNLILVYIASTVVMAALAFLRPMPDGVDRGVVLCWLTAVAWEILLLLKAPGPWDYQFAVLRFLLVIPAFIILIDKSRTIRRELPILLVLSFYIYWPTMRSAIHNAVHYAKHGELIYLNFNFDASSQLVKTLSRYPNVPLLMWGSACSVYQQSGRKALFSPYYYFAPLDHDGYLSSTEIDCMTKAMEEQEFIFVDVWNGSIMSHQGSEILRRVREKILKDFKLVESGVPSFKMYIPRQWDEMK